MEIVIDIDESVPAFARAWIGNEVTELVEQIKNAVRRGKLCAGDALPSIRQLANDLDLDCRTVAKAYRVLERDSVVQTRGYRGAFVHSHARANVSKPPSPDGSGAR